jgi:selenocysteine-specific elongation factor
LFVIGTAGHIDHGKSVLVHALTGIDPDRLIEEKERGMTIDLGFAWFKLPSGREVGIVDVPGHERFVRNMLAGVGGIDLALLVIAANEGVMPQTREHLAIIDLLGISKGVVAITKKDLVDDEWLAVVRLEIEELLEPTTLSKAPVVAVSAVTGEGLDGLVSTIDSLLAAATPREDTGRPRMPIDRVFTIAGSGTVVTGTLLDGSLSVGQEVEIVPSGLRSRIRGLQTHKARLDVATPGSRVAANLVGLTTSQLQRGDVLTRPGWLVPATMLSARLRLLSYVRRPLRHNARLGFYTGAAEAIARLRLLESDELKPGESAFVQLLLDRPVALLNGDHFVVRSSTDTLGGGRVIDAHAGRLRRFRPDVIDSLRIREGGTAEEIIITSLELKQPLAQSDLLASINLSQTEAQSAIGSLVRQGKLLSLGSGGSALLFTASGWQALAQKASAIVQEYHRKFPTRSGMPKVELANRLKLGAGVSTVLSGLVSSGILAEDGLVVRLPGHKVSLTPAQQAKIDAFLESLAQDPYSPPSDLIPETDLLKLLVDSRQVVRLTENVVFATSAYEEMVQQVTRHIKEKGKITLAGVRDMFQTSRKYAQAFLEHLDSKKITRRVGDERVLY